LLDSVQLTLMMGPIIAVPVPATVWKSLAEVEVNIYDHSSPADSSSPSSIAQAVAAAAAVPAHRRNAAAVHEVHSVVTV